MARHDHSRYQQGIIRRHYDHKDTLALQKLSEIVSDLYIADGGSGTRKLWDSARIALMKLASTDPRTAKVLASRDVRELARFVSLLSADARRPETEEGGQIAEAEASPIIEATPALQNEHGPHVEAQIETTTHDAPVAAGAPSREELKRAMKAFRKRLKLKRLDDESRLGRSPLSAGKQSQTIAIMAPREFPQQVWDELVAQGKLKRSGSYYELVE